MASSAGYPRSPDDFGSSSRLKLSMSSSAGYPRSPDDFGSLVSASSAGEDGEHPHGRGSKHGALPEEFERGCKRYIGVYGSTVSTSSTGSSAVLQDITADEARSGCKKSSPKAIATVASDQNKTMVQAVPMGNLLPNRCQRRVLKSASQPARFKRVPPSVPSVPSTGRPQPALPQVNNTDEACHKEVEEVEKSLEDMRVDRGELTWGGMVGAGATAMVFKGTWSRMPGQAVAIKKLTCSSKDSTKLKQEVALLREITLTASILHDHLVKFYGFTFDVQPYLLITEFCEGSTCFHLLHAVDPVELEIKQQLKMCSDIACAMDYLHKFRPQIIHRDLKSLNLLLAEKVVTTTDVPHVKVSDFGLSKMKDEDVGWNKMTSEVGTPNWMAPEVARGSYNEKVDIYSFAMVLFEVICNEIPFEDLEIADVFLTSSGGGRPDMEAIPPKTPVNLVELMQQCWAQEPSERPSFEDIAATLRTINRSAGSTRSWGDLS